MILEIINPITFKQTDIKSVYLVLLSEYFFDITSSEYNNPFTINLVPKVKKYPDIHSNYNVNIYFKTSLSSQQEDLH